MSKYNLDAFDAGVLKHEAEMATPGMAESAGLGLAQGVTLGFGDELYGAGKGAIDTLTQDKPMDLESLIANYTKNRDAARSEMASAENENPITYNLSNVLGGLALPMGALGTASKGASLAQKALQGAKLGAAAGGLAGLGSSEADLTKGEVGQAAKDTAVSAAMGGGLGGAIGGLVQPGLNSAAGWLQESKGGQKIANAFNKAEAGVKMSGKAAALREAEATKAVAQDVAAGINDLKKYAGKIKGEALSGGEQVAITDKYKELSDKLKDIVPASEDEARLVAKYQNMLDKLVQKTMVNLEGEAVPALTRIEATPEEIDKTTQALNKMLYKNKNLPYEGAQAGKEISEELSNLTKQGLSPESTQKMDIANKGYVKGLEAQANIGGMRGSAGTTEEARAMYEKQLNNLTDTIQKTFAKPTDMEAVGLKQAFDKSRQNIETMNKSLMDMTQDTEKLAELKAMRDSQMNKINDLEKRANEQALNMATVHGLGGTSPFEGEGFIKKWTGMSGEAAKLQVATGAGKASRIVKTTIPDAITKMSSAVYKASPESMQSMVDHLTAKASPYAQKLAAVMKQPDRVKNAMLFALMQQPGFREDIGDAF